MQLFPRLALASVLAVISSGCVLGPTAIRMGHQKYNEAIAITKEEQLLLNLVRLRYGRAPVFLDLDSVSAQFVFNESADLGATINEGPTRFNPDALGLGGQIDYSERPTLTYTPLKGNEFVRRMLSRTSLETIALLSQSGWSIDRVLRLTVQEMNGLGNAATASGPTPEIAPDYADFAQASELLRELQKQGLVSFVHQTHPIEQSDAIPASAVSAEAVVAASKAGYSFRASDDGASYRLMGEKKAPVILIAPKALDVPEGQSLVELLRLTPGNNRYEVTTEALGLATDTDDSQYDRLTIVTRSLIGTMFYLSHAIDIPGRHASSGIVTVTHNALGDPFDWSQVLGDVLNVHSSLMPPTRPAVKVRYQNYWFYIDDTDTNSKATFALLAQLFDLQAGQESVAAPVLTLPVGG